MASGTYLDGMQPAHIQVTVGYHKDPDRGLRLSSQKPQKEQLSEH